MITILGEPGDSQGQLQLSPRRGHKTGNKVLVLPLIYGHTCPFCGNVLQAMFQSASEVDLFPYEETNILTTSDKAERQGEVIKILPGEHRDEGCYRVYHSHGQQLIQLKRHLLRFAALRGERETVSSGNTKLNAFEPGETPCKYIGLFSRRHDLMLYDLGLAFGMKPQELDSGYNLPKQKDLQALVQNHAIFRLVPAVGNVPPIVQMEWYTINRGYNYWYREVLKPYRKTD